MHFLKKQTNIFLKKHQPQPQWFYYPFSRLASHLHSAANLPRDALWKEHNIHFPFCYFSQWDWTSFLCSMWDAAGRGCLHSGPEGEGCGSSGWLELRVRTAATIIQSVSLSLSTYISFYNHRGQYIWMYIIRMYYNIQLKETNSSQIFFFIITNCGFLASLLPRYDKNMRSGPAFFRTGGISIWTCHPLYSIGSTG